MADVLEFLKDILAIERGKESRYAEEDAKYTFVAPQDRGTLPLSIKFLEDAVRHLPSVLRRQGLDSVEINDNYHPLPAPGSYVHPLWFPGTALYDRVIACMRVYPDSGKLLAEIIGTANPQKYGSPYLYTFICVLVTAVLKTLRDLPNALGWFDTQRVRNALPAFPISKTFRRQLQSFKHPDDKALTYLLLIYMSARPVEAQLDGSCLSTEAVERACQEWLNTPEHEDVLECLEARGGCEFLPRPIDPLNVGTQQERIDFLDDFLRRPSAGPLIRVLLAGHMTDALDNAIATFYDAAQMSGRARDFERGLVNRIKLIEAGGYDFRYDRDLTERQKATYRKEPLLLIYDSIRELANLARLRKEEKFEIAQPKYVPVLPEGWSIFIAEDSGQQVSLGTYMKNCVGEYAHDIREGNPFIMTIYRTDGDLSEGLNLFLGWSGRKIYFTDQKHGMLGYRNREPEGEEWEILYSLGYTRMDGETDRRGGDDEVEELLDRAWGGGIPLESEPKKVPLRKWTGNEITPPWEVGMEEMYRKNPRRAVYTDLPLRLLQDICNGV